ncbi:hypothetical protein Tco_0945503 [Tanacetum coccineum]
MCILHLSETSARLATVVPKNTSSFTTTIPPPPLFFIPLLQQATPTPTPTTSEATTSLPVLLYFASIFKFNERVFNLEKDMSEIKQVDQYAQALSSIPAIVDRYMDNKLREAINKVILAHNLYCKQEAQDEKNAYIELVDTSIRALIKEEKNVTESVEVAVLTRSFSQPTSTYEATASLSEFELTKILIDKMEKNKSHDKADYKKKLYDALVESYNTNKDLFDSYGEVFSLNRSQDERDKDQDPSTGSDRGTKRRKSSKDAESSRDSRSKEKKSSNTSKAASQSQHKSFGKFDHAEEPSHTVEDSGMQQDQEFVMGDNDEQPTDKTWISQVKRAEEPPTSFDEVNDTLFDFSVFVINWLKIPNLTQEILVGPAFNLLKGTCKSIMKLEYHLEECSKATTKRLDWHNPENKPRRLIAVTILKIMKKYDYGHMEEIKVRRDDQKLYTFKEGDFKRLRLQDIKDMLILLVQQKLTNLTIDERDGTLNDVQSALHDIAVGIRMEYLPMRKWSNLDKKRDRVMVQDIDKKLY